MERILVTLLIILVLTLTACGASNATAQAGIATQSDSTAAALPTETELLLGTFKLEGTEQAVTADQATELLPLWQVYADLLTSDNAAQAEIDALIQQIQDTMTDAQLNAIRDMNLSQQDAFAIMQSQGITMGAGTSGTSSSPSSSSGGGMPAEGPPAGGDPGSGSAGPMPGGDLGMGGQALSSDQFATAQASGQTSGEGMSQIPAGLIDALIQLLETKVSS